MASVILGLTAARKDELEYCEAPLVMWLNVSGILEAIDIVKCILMSCYVHKGNFDPVTFKPKWEAFDFCLFANIRMAWKIYGNMIIYSPEARECRDFGANADSLYKLALTLVIFGYLLFLCYIPIGLAHLKTICNPPQSNFPPPPANRSVIENV